MKNKICYISGARSEFGIISGLLKNLKKNKSFKLDVIFTGSHLSNFYGNTINEAKNIGLNNYYKSKILTVKNNKIDTANLISSSISKINRLLKKINPKLVILVGDRYETFSAAIVAYSKGIPILHFHGGEKTLNSLDDNYRHSISKLSHYHFVSNKIYKKRLIQLGEVPKSIFICGSLSLKNIDKNNFFSKKIIEKKFKIAFKEHNIIVNFNSETLSKKKTENDINIVLSSLEKLKNTCIIFTMPGADVNNDIIFKKINKFVKEHKNSYFVKSFGVKYYYSILNIVDLMIGNSSSGIIEMPFFNKPTINLGKRQHGRVMPKSVINFKISKKLIEQKISNILKYKKSIRGNKNPYYNKMTFKQIENIIENILKKKISFKVFKDLSF